MGSNSEDLRELHACVDKGMKRLALIWDKIGIFGDSRVARKRVVTNHLEGLFTDMVKEEDILKDMLIANMEKFSVEVRQLCNELALPTFKVSEDITILQAEKELRQKVETLTKEKQSRMKKLKSLAKIDEALAKELHTVAYEISLDVVPSLARLEEFENYICELEQEKKRRQEKATNLHNRIIQLLEELELSPNTSFERNFVCDLDTIALTSNNLRVASEYKSELELLLDENKSQINKLWTKVQSLWTKLNLPEDECSKFRQENVGVSQRIIMSLMDEATRCEQLKLQNIRMFVIETRKELTQIWDKCYVPHDVRKQFGAFYQDEMSEELLEEHEREVKKMTDFYEANKEMLELVSRRQKLWAEFLELEHRANNPDRFFNRGGNLLREEKHRKKVLSELPKVEQEVLEQIKMWEVESGREFLVGGMRFEEFIRKEREEYHAEKENEKMLRQQLKAKQMEEEIMFGCKPATPGTKRFAPSITCRTPNKSRKLDTPSSSRLGSAQKSRHPAPSPSGNRVKITCRLDLPPHHATADVRSTVSSTMERAVSYQTLSTTPRNKMNHGIGGSMVGLSAAISTTVVAAPSSSSSGGSEVDFSSASLCPVGHYEDFANTLNKMSRQNTRSTLVPKPGQNYF